MRPLRLLSMVWGKHLELFEKVLLRSLFQPNNLPKILASGREIEMMLMTPERDRDQAISLLEKAAQQHPIDCSWVNGVQLADGVVAAMCSCLVDNALLMLTPPDTFFADGSLSNLVTFHGDRDGMCVSGFHVRVLEQEFLDWVNLVWSKCSPDSLDISSDNLVDIAFRYAHPSFKLANIDSPINNSRHGGIYIQKVSEGLWTITHRLPTVYLASVTVKDKDRFAERRQFNEWDWAWPARLQLDKRYKCLTSSDLFFAVELTHADRNIPKDSNNDQLVDEFTLRDYHYDNNRFMVGSLRGSES